MGPDQEPQSHWFALQVRARTEQQVATALRAKGYEEFLPTRIVKTKHNSTAMPLFPGYIFCRIRTHVHALIVTTPGVIRIVEFGGKPAPVDPEEIRSIQIIAKSGVPTCVLKNLQAGDKICIEDGPLRGVVGILTSFSPKQRLLVSITMMMRTVVAEVDSDWIAAIRPATLKKMAVSENPMQPLSRAG